MCGYFRQSALKGSVKRCPFSFPAVTMNEADLNAHAQQILQTLAAVYLPVGDIEPSPVSLSFIRCEFRL